MRCNILIWCFWLFSLCFVQKGVANVVLDPQTNRPISADSILNNVMTFAPFYEKLVTDYRADLYIKGTMDIKRKNFILRYVPSMFRLQKVYGSIWWRRIVICILQLLISMTKR